MKIGTVKFFNESKGFGFITPDDDKVTYEVEEGKKGLNAVNVSLAD